MYPTDLKQGDTFRRTLSLTYKDSGNPVSLTGVNAYCQVRRSPGQELLLTATATVDAANGKISVVLSKDQTAALESGEYGFDVRIESGDDRQTLYTEWVNVILPFTERSNA